MLCVVCTVHKETRSVSFLVEPQNQGRRFVGQFSPVWTQNRWQRILLVWPQNWWLRFPGLCLKTCSYGLVI
jgi:hypothetical protein